ncbi:hypothetical protein HDU86_007340 [Geranomyces michiganensis]|nr:hypothetical protein HDU86_007340 [Geranomyces michiganensis]
MSTQNFAVYLPQIIVPSSPLDLDDHYGAPYTVYPLYDTVPRLDGWDDTSYDAGSELANDQFWTMGNPLASRSQSGTAKQFTTYQPANSKQPQTNKINTKLRSAILRNRAQDLSSGHASAALSELLTAEPLNYYSPASTGGASWSESSVGGWEDSLSTDTTYSTNGSPYYLTKISGEASYPRDRKTLPSIEEADGKQPCYREMLRYALNSHPEGRMPLSELYSWITTHYPNFVNKVAKWKPNTYPIDTRTVSSLEEAIYAGFSDEGFEADGAAAAGQRHSSDECVAWLDDQYLLYQQS